MQNATVYFLMKIGAYYDDQCAGVYINMVGNLHQKDLEYIKQCQQYMSAKKYLIIWSMPLENNLSH